MKKFLVGGAVRDGLLGRPVKDRDFVVVGATAEEMLAEGFQQVGADFPVFLHPVTGDEYALARQERKVGSGYHGFETHFEPDVTLEDDLVRRDLTVNAMARDEETGELFDPFNGQQDLRDGVLRHVSEAFAEDPVRVLRVARFRARYGFDIAPETMGLMQQLVDDGELDHLTPERVWAETEKALMEDRPSLFFHTMLKCGATEVLMPELDRSIFGTGLALNRTALWGLSLEHRVLVLVSEMSPGNANRMLTRLKAPTKIIRAATKFCEAKVWIEQHPELTAEMVMELLTRIDVWRNGELLREMNLAIASTFNMRVIAGVDLLTHAYFVASGVCFASLTPEQQDTLKGKDVGRAIYAERLRLVRTRTGI